MEEKMNAVTEKLDKMGVFYTVIPNSNGQIKVDTVNL